MTTAYDTIYETVSSQQQPGWLTDLRASGYEKFQSQGFPTRRDEEWKYTSVKPIEKRSFGVAVSSVTVDLKAYADFLAPDAIELVFVDGVFSAEQSHFPKLPAGVTMKSLSQALKENEAAVQSVISQQDSHLDNAFNHLNAALHQDGSFIDVQAKTVCEPVLHLVYLFTSSANDVVACPRNVIQVGESAQVTILESHVSRDHKVVYFNNSRTDMAIAANAQVQYYKLQADGLSAYNVSNTRISQEADSRLESFCMTVGGKLVRNNLSIALNGSGIFSGLDGLYAIGGEQHVDNHTAVDHRFPNSESSQLYKGILHGKSRAVFNGKIFVQQPAQKTNAYQLNRNVLLSPDAEVDTKPQLEIFADDVRCTHGATIGKLNEDELFYLQSRCIPRKQAINILSHGFADDVLYRITNEKLRLQLRGILCEYSLDIEGRLI